MPHNKATAEEQQPTQQQIPEGEPLTVKSDSMSRTLANSFKQYNPADAPKDFFGMVASPRRHGKTTLLTDWLRQWHKQKRFTHTMVWSKTLSGYEDYVPAGYQWDDLGNVREVVSRQMDVAEYNEKIKKNKGKESDYIHCSILLILDDMASETRDLRSGETGHILRWLSCNGRHVTRRDPNPKNECSVIILSQMLTLFPPSLRGNCDFMCCARLANKFERERLVYENLTLRTDREGMRAAYSVLDDITLSKPYRMCVICKHKAERQTHEDYVYYYDAQEAEGVRLFGTELEWAKPLKRVRF